MFLLNILAVVGSILGFVFLTLSLASGLYYISELIETKTVYTKKVLTKLIFGITITFVLLIFTDGLPIKLCLLSIISHGVYYKNLEKFPMINLHNIYFILSIVLVITNHYCWFKYFNKPQPIPPQYRYDPKFKMQAKYSFPQVASFFGILVWLIPFALFISLSANDLALPTQNEFNSNTNSNNSSFASSKKKQHKGESLGKQFIKLCREYFELFINIFTGQFEKIKENRKKNDGFEGLI
ncbi:hypothetical protein ACO0SA_004589 [Hanseniaspora valbyensis]